MTVLALVIATFGAVALAGPTVLDLPRRWRARRRIARRFGTAEAAWMVRG